MDIGREIEKAKQKEAYRKSSAVKGLKPVEVGEWGLNDPGDYDKLYPMDMKVRSTDKSELSRLFLDGESSHSSPLLSRSPIAVLPGMYSHSSDFLSFLRATADDLDSKFVPDLDEEGFSKTGIYTGFGNLKSPAGYFQVPMSYTTVDNSAYREELGLSQGYSSREKQIAAEFWDLILSEVKAAPVNVAKLSTGGMRRFSRSVQWKLDYANYLTQPDNFERMLNMVAMRDSVGLANEFETVYATYIQKRGQVDSVGKTRWVFDLEYALSGGRKGEPKKADKSVRINNVDWPDFAGIRARVVHAGPWTVNCFLQMVATPTMQSMFDRFPNTFHVNTAEEIKSVVDGRYVFCSDVTEYDRSMSKDAIATVHDCMRKYWDERIVDASWRLFTSPYYAKPLGIERGEGTWVLNPMDWTDELFAGNRSGHALTSVIAKGNKVVESLFVIDKMYPVLGRVKEFLDHKHPIKLVNNGDDEIVVCDTQRDMERFKALRSDLKNGHYVVSPEDGNGYSGTLLLKTDIPLVYNPSPRIHTSLLKMFVPERGVGTGHRQYWPIGMMTRIDNLTQTDIGREVWQIALHHYRRWLEPVHGDIRAIIERGASEMRLPLAGLTMQEREVIEDPSKLHYKWTPDEVSEDVLNLVTSKVPQRRVESILKKYFFGHIK